MKRLAVILLIIALAGCLSSSSNDATPTPGASVAPGSEDAAFNELEGELNSVDLNDSELEALLNEAAS